jgi:hypothetical protein
MLQRADPRGCCLRSRRRPRPHSAAPGAARQPPGQAARAQLPPRGARGAGERRRRSDRLRSLWKAVMRNITKSIYEIDLRCTFLYCAASRQTLRLRICSRGASMRGRSCALFGSSVHFTQRHAPLELQVPASEQSRSVRHVASPLLTPLAWPRAVKSRHFHAPLYIFELIFSSVVLHTEQAGGQRMAGPPVATLATVAATIKSAAPPASSAT